MSFVSVLFWLSGCGGKAVPPLPATTTALQAGATTTLAGTSIPLTATVTGILPAAQAGSVNFLAAGTFLGSVPISQSGAVTLNLPTTLASASYSITATYSGNAASAASTSAPVTVNVQSPTITTVAASPNSIQQGQAFVVAATITRTDGTGLPTGTVTFASGSQTLGTAAITSGTATAYLSVSSAAYPLGTLPLSATYAGDALNVPSASANTSAYVGPAADVLTFRHDAQRTGVYPVETTLTPANVNPSTFGQLFTFPIDGYAYPQPLYVSNYTMADGNQHNVLFIETSSGSVYAFDADNNNPEQGYLWHTTVNVGAEQAVTTADLGCIDTPPGTSVVGTPVIDRALGVMYLVAKSKLAGASGTSYIQRIHALNLADGSEALNGPTVIAASVKGTGTGSSGGSIAFDAFAQNQRAALVEANGSVWIAWGSHCDAANYHGWVIGYNQNDISQQTAVFNDTPNGSEGGIWMSGGGISADNRGNLYLVAGNGTFDANDHGSDYGDTVMRVAIGQSATKTTLTVADWFTPINQEDLSEYDLDMGTTDLMLFDDPASGTTPHMGITSDKTGKVYLLDRDALGDYSTGTGSTNGDLAEAGTGQQMFTNITFFNNTVYVGAGGSPLQAFPYTPGTETTAGYLSFTPSSESAWTFSANWASGGLQPVVSANGTADGIAWGMDVSGDVLNAFDASNLGNQIYVSNSNPDRDQAPPPVKFAPPIIANGRVYLAGQGLVAVYGLLSPDDAARARHAARRPAPQQQTVPDTGHRKQ